MPPKGLVYGGHMADKVMVRRTGVGKLLEKLPKWWSTEHTREHQDLTPAHQMKSQKWEDVISKHSVPMCILHCTWPQIEHFINDIVGKKNCLHFQGSCPHSRNKWKSNNFRSYWGTIWVHCTWGTEDKLQIEQDISFKQILADKDWVPRALSTQDGFCHFYCRHHKTIKSQHKSTVPKTHQK